jgi:hypothetical protein
VFAPYRQYSRVALLHFSQVRTLGPGLDPRPRPCRMTVEPVFAPPRSSRWPPFRGGSPSLKAWEEAPCFSTMAGPPLWCGWSSVAGWALVLGPAVRHARPMASVEWWEGLPTVPRASSHGDDGTILGRCLVIMSVVSRCSPSFRLVLVLATGLSSFMLVAMWHHTASGGGDMETVLRIIPATLLPRPRTQ